MSENLIVVNVDFGETRVALIEGGMIAELLLERRHQRSILGNIYRGQVTRVLPGMQAAFVDVGLERDAFLHVSDLIGSSEDLDEITGESGQQGDPPRQGRKRESIRKMISQGEAIVVQISKEPISTKGARVTARVSLPGRHLVFMPNAQRGGVSRRIPKEEERRRLSKVLRLIAPKQGALIARTVAAGASADALEADANYLGELWEQIRSRYRSRQKPGLLHEELDLSLRVLRDRFNDTVSEVIVDDQACYDRLRSFVDRLLPSRLGEIKRYTGGEPIFDAFGIEDEIKRALDRVVRLPSGGTLVIDQGEALTAIDVNTGKFVGKGSKDQEETILITNLEAVDEIAYQLRFRNIGGLIVLDLIDMDRPRNQNKVLERLKEQLQEDRARTQVVKISRFGLVEMTRERTRESLGRTLHQPCPYCDGTGQILSRFSVANEVLRDLWRRRQEFGRDVQVRLHQLVFDVFASEAAAPLKELEKRIGKKIWLMIDADLHVEEFVLQARKASAGREG